MEHRIQRVGILDANDDMEDVLSDWLLQRGYLADIMRDTNSMVDYCKHLKPAAVIIELTNAGDQGPELVGKIRKTGYTAPIIAMSVERDDTLQINALQQGADDFLLKPVEAKQLLQRLELILRKFSGESATSGPSPVERLDELLTATEKRIFHTLRDHSPDPLSRDQIMWEVKRQRMTPDDRSIDVYISNIRRKLRIVKPPLEITTVRGVGFALTQD